MRAGMATIGMLVGLVLTLGSCGGGGSTGAESTAATATARTATVSPNRCRRQLGRFVGAMAALRDALARGLSYEQYLGEVRAIRAVYARIRPPAVPAGCLLAAGTPGERAFNLYIEAANAWGDCLATAGCQTRAIESRLQDSWARAARRLALAQSGMRG